MKFRLTSDNGPTVTIDVRPGDNVWIANEAGEEIGSLYLANDGAMLGLGCYDVQAGGWEYADSIPTVV